MNANNKRYLPILALVAVAAVGVYLTRGDRLTGEAGSVGADSQMARLGKVDNKLLTRLDELVQKSVVPHVRGGTHEVVIGMQAEIEKLGTPALASLTTHFRDNGCFQPGSAAEVELIGGLMQNANVTPVQRRVIAYTLIDAAAHAAEQLKYDTPKVKPFSSRPEIATLVEQLKDGSFNGELPSLAGITLDENTIIWDCTFRALAAAAAALRTGVVDAESLLRQSLGMVHTLPKGHPAAAAFANVATLAANASKQPAAEFVKLIENPSLSDDVRAVACHNAIDVKIPLADLKKAAGDPPSKPLVGCLIEAGDPDAIELAQRSDDVDLRIAGIMHGKLSADPVSIKESLTALYTKPMSHRERFARIDVVARSVASCPDPEACLAPLPELEAAHPELKLPPAFAKAFAQHNTQKPTIALSAKADPKALPTMLAKLAKGGGTVMLPSAMPTKTIGEKLTIDLPDAKLAACDKVIRPGNGQQVVDEAFRNLETGIVCATAGKYTGPVELTIPGMRLVAVEKGVVFDGALIIASAAAVVGLEITGPVVVSETARGTVLSNNKLLAGGLAITDQVSMVGNTLQEGTQFTVPGGVVLVENSVPGRFVLKGEEDGKLKKVGSTAVTLDARWPPRMN